MTDTTARDRAAAPAPRSRLQATRRRLRRFVARRLATTRSPQQGAWTSYLPGDHARQVNSRYYIEEAMTAADAPATVVDLGCGNGVSREHFRRWKPDVKWVGVDIEQSDLAKAITGEEVILYDGVHLPFRTDSVPLIYTNQVFEHVRYPERLLREIRRVLTPGGLFIGSTSQLEPYHAWSLWGGYTLYGWRTLCQSAGLVLEEARPSIDAIALITRQFEGAKPEHNAWWESSPLNAAIDAWAQETGADVATTNGRKLQFTGQFAFRVRKPANASGPGLAGRYGVVRARQRLGTFLLDVGRRLAN